MSESQRCLTCASNNGDLEDMTNDEWNTFELLLQPYSGENTIQTYFEYLRNLQTVRICAKCVNALQCIDNFKRCALRSIQNLIEMWNRQDFAIPPANYQVPMAPEALMVNEPPNRETNVTTSSGFNADPIAQTSPNRQCGSVKVEVECLNDYVDVHPEVIMTEGDAIAPSPNSKRGNRLYCERCDKWYSRRSYKQHLKTSAKHNKEKGQAPCDICKKIVPKSSLKSHMQRHSNANHCKVCDQWFTDRAFKIHIAHALNHMSDENFKFTCDQCGKKFMTHTTRRRHINAVHLKLTPFKCQLCGIVFKRTATLNKHVLVVHENKTVPKNYVCDVCGSAWEAKCLLARHMVVHTGERPYKCKSCDATFGHSGALYTHNKLIHEKKKRKSYKKAKNNVEMMTNNVEMMTNNVDMMTNNDLR